MKERIQEALRRRHRKGDEGFTLIELLVVILIIAILAAVGIVALLSALNAGKKSAAKTSLRNATTSVKAEQTGKGQTDFDGITYSKMKTSDPDLKWEDDTALSGTGNTNVISFSGSATQVTLATRSDNGVCYFAQLNAEGKSQYASVVAGVGTGCDKPSTASPTWKDSIKDGWNN